MTHRLMSAIANRDGSALARMSNPATQAMQGIVNPDAENLVDALFRQLKQVFPAASQTNLRRPEDENAAKNSGLLHSLRMESEPESSYRQGCNTPDPVSLRSGLHPVNLSHGANKVF